MKPALKLSTNYRVRADTHNVATLEHLAHRPASAPTGGMVSHGAKSAMRQRLFVTLFQQLLQCVLVLLGTGRQHQLPIDLFGSKMLPDTEVQ